MITFEYINDVHNIHYRRVVLFVYNFKPHSSPTTAVPDVMRQTSYLSMEALQCGEVSSESRRGETSLMTMQSHTIYNLTCEGLA